MSELTAALPNGRGNLLPMVRMDLQVIGWKAYLAAIALIMVFVTMLGDVISLSVFTTVMTWMACFGILRAKEQSRVDLLLGALPVQRRTVIKAHYLVFLGVGALMLLACVGGGLVAHLLGRTVDTGSLALTTLPGVWAVAIAFPLGLRFGLQKALWGGIVAVWTMTAIGTRLAFALTEKHQAASLGATPWLVAGIAASVVALAVSYLASVRIYSRKDL